MKAIGGPDAEHRELRNGFMLSGEDERRAQRARGTRRDRRMRVSRATRGTRCTTPVTALSSSAGSPRKSSVRMARHTPSVSGHTWMHASVLKSASSRSIAIRPARPACRSPRARWPQCSTARTRAARARAGSAHRRGCRGGCACRDSGSHLTPVERISRLMVNLPLRAPMRAAGSLGDGDELCHRPAVLRDDDALATDSVEQRQALGLELGRREPSSWRKPTTGQNFCAHFPTPATRTDRTPPRLSGCYNVAP